MVVFDKMQAWVSPLYLLIANVIGAPEWAQPSAWGVTLVLYPSQTGGAYSEFAFDVSVEPVDATEMIVMFNTADRERLQELPLGQYRYTLGEHSGIPTISGVMEVVNTGNEPQESSYSGIDTIKTYEPRDHQNEI